MQCLQLFMILGLQWISVTIVSGARRNPVSTVTAASVPSSTTRRSRVFSNAGIHEVEAPKLGRPGATPPPPPIVRHHIPEVPSSGFKPIYTSRRPSRRRPSPPPSLDYGTDIITIYDLDKNRNHQINNDTWVRTVSSTLQVEKDDAKPDTVSRGKVFDDVIYDYNASPGDSFKPQETIVDVRRLKPVKDNRNTNSWRKLSSSEVYSF